VKKQNIEEQQRTLQTLTDSHSQTANSNCEIENKEVHKHSTQCNNNKKKKWTEYLLEFLMLLCSVPLASIAENIREGV